MKNSRRAIAARKATIAGGLETFLPRLESLESRDAPSSGIPASFEQRGPGGGGALFSPALSPHPNGPMFIASDMSQLFRSTDMGTSWTVVDFRQLQGGHESQVQFTSDPNVMYSVDYTTFADGLSVQRPMKSVNGGLNWSPLASDPTSGGVYKLFVDPADANRILLSSYSALYWSSNGGASFAQKYSTANSNGLHLGGAFFDGASIYVGTSAGLLVSNNGGATFSVSSTTGIPAGEAILSFAGAKQSGITRLAAVTKPAASVYAGIQAWDYAETQRVYVVDFGAGSWTQKMAGIPSTAYPYYVGMANNDVNTIYVAGSNTIAYPTVYKTTNGGNNWTSVFVTTNNQNIATGWQGAGGDRPWSYGEVSLGFAVQSNDSSRVVITDFGFAHKTTNGGTSWQQMYVNPADQNPAGSNIVQGRWYRDSGLDNTTAWQITWPSASRMIVSNSDIRGSISADGGQSFGFGYAGHTRNSMYRAVVHPSTGIVYAATSSVHDLYQSTYLTDARIDGGNGAVLFSTNQGQTWQTLRDFGKPVVWVAVDPTNPNRLYAAVAHSTVGGIYVTNNLNAGASSTWTKLADPPRTQGHAFNIVVLNDGTLVVSYSGRRAGSPLAFTNSSGVFVSTDGGQTWADRSDPGMVYWTKDVVVDPHDPSQNTWYAGVFSGWGGPPNGLGGLYKTTNRGATWTRVVNSHRVTSITFNPNDVNEAWMTTETAGLWHSSNMRAATPTFTQVASYPFRQPERVFYNPFSPNEIWVTSFGNGIRVGMLAANQPPTNHVPGAQSMVEGTPLVFSTANGNRIWISDPDAGTGDMQVALSATTGVMSLGSVAGLSFVSGSNVSGAMTFRGTLTAINNALEGLSYQAAFHTASASIAIIANDLGNGGGDPLTDSDSITIGIDRLPKVAAVYLRGSTWSGSFLGHLASSGLGSSAYGFAVGTGTEQAKPLPWINVDRISIAFTEPVDVAAGSLELRGLLQPVYSLSGFSYDAAAWTATWALGAVLTTDRLRLDLAALGAFRVRDLTGNALDGHWVDGSSVFVSGNSTAGTNFLFRFNVLPGAALRDSTVRNADVNSVRSSLFTTVGVAGYSAFFDLDGSGTVQNADVNAVRQRLFDTLPNGTPMRPGREAAKVGGRPSGRISRANFPRALELALMDDFDWR